MPSPSILAQLEEEDAARWNAERDLAFDSAGGVVERDPEWYESSADRERRLHPVHIMMDLDRFTSFAYQVAGAATAPLLQDNPDYVFPAEDVAEAVKNVMREFGIVPPY